MVINDNDKFMKKSKVSKRLASMGSKFYGSVILIVLLGSS